MLVHLYGVLRHILLHNIEEDIRSNRIALAFSYELASVLSYLDKGPKERSEVLNEKTSTWLQVSNDNPFQFEGQESNSTEEFQPR